MERLVAGLLQDNLRLETTVKQLQNCCGHTSRRGGPGGRDVRLPRAIINNRASRCELQEEFVEGSWQAEPELPQSPSDTIPPNNSKTMSMEESTPQEKKESSEPVAKNCGNWRRKDGLRSPGDGVEDNGGAITDTKMAGRDCILGCTVLSKTEALKGMVQAQVDSCSCTEHRLWICVALLMYLVLGLPVHSSAIHETISKGSWRLFYLNSSRRKSRDFSAKSSTS